MKSTYIWSVMPPSSFTCVLMTKLPNCARRSGPASPNAYVAGAAPGASAHTATLRVVAMTARVSHCFFMICLLENRAVSVSRVVFVGRSSMEGSVKTRSAGQAGAQPISGRGRHLNRVMSERPPEDGVRQIQGLRTFHRDRDQPGEMLVPLDVQGGRSVGAREVARQRCDNYIVLKDR